MNFSSTRNLYSYGNGDTITPGMGVSIDPGYGLSQFWNITKGGVDNTDFTQHPAKLFPQAWSTMKGKFVVPERGTWHYNNPEAAALTFDSNGNCTTSGLSSIFRLTTIEQNGLTFPALEIIGNLARANDLTDKCIYFKGHYQKLDFVCQQLISIQVSSADAFDILISTTGADGTGDDVLSNDNDWVKLTPMLQRAGTTVSGTVAYTWQRLVNGSWVNIQSQSSMIVINAADNSLTAYNAAVEGVESFRCVATYGNKTYYKIKEISDVHDPYYIVDYCTHTDGVGEGETAVFKPKVIDRATNTPDTLHSWNFSYTVTKLPSGDVVKTATGAQFSLTYDEIESYGGNIMTRILATGV